MSYGPAVLGGRMRYTSVSQLDKFDERVRGGCNRRWWYRYVARVPEPEKAPQKLGQQVHAQVEHYLKTGRDSLGPLARAGKRFIPAPGGDLLVEHEFGRLYELAPGGFHGPMHSLLSAGGVPFVGKIDVLHLRGYWLDDDGAMHFEPGVPEVIDWKTSKTIRDVVNAITGEVERKAWTKTPEQIADGWQGRGYTKLALELWPDAPAVRIGHGYFQTLGRQDALKVTGLVEASRVQTRWAEADELVSRMQAVARLTRAEDVTPNYDACGAYGPNARCPFEAECPRDAKLILAAALKPRR